VARFGPNVASWSHSTSVPTPEPCISRTSAFAHERHAPAWTQRQLLEQRPKSLLNALIAEHTIHEFALQPVIIRICISKTLPLGRSSLTFRRCRG
jgi:hypothetical protein